MHTTNLRGIKFGNAFLGIDVVNEDLWISSNCNELITEWRERHRHRLNSIVIQSEHAGPR